MAIERRMKRVKLRAMRWGLFDGRRVELDHLPAATCWLLTLSVANNKVGGQRLHR